MGNAHRPRYEWRLARGPFGIRCHIANWAGCDGVGVGVAGVGYLHAGYG